MHSEHASTEPNSCRVSLVIRLTGSGGESDNIVINMYWLKTYLWGPWRTWRGNASWLGRSRLCWGPGRCHCRTRPRPPVTPRVTCQSRSPWRHPILRRTSGTLRIHWSWPETTRCPSWDTAAPEVPQVLAEVSWPDTRGPAAGSVARPWWGAGHLATVLTWTLRIVQSWFSLVPDAWHHPTVTPTTPDIGSQGDAETCRRVINCLPNKKFTFLAI